MPGQARPVTGLSGNPNLGGAATAPGSFGIGARPGSGASSFQRPTSADVGSFLNLPQQPSGGFGGANAAARTSPAAQGGSGNGFQSKSYTTPGGSTITIGAGSGSGTTQGGANVGGAGAGIKVEGADGGTYVKGTGAVGVKQGDNAAIAAGSRTGVQTASGAGAVQATGVRAATDGTNSAIRGGSAAAVRDASGNAAANVRGGYADSSGYRQGGSLTAARNQWGYTAASARGGYGQNGTGSVGALAGVRGPGGTTIAAGRGATFQNGQFVGGQTWSAVNGNYTRWGVFAPGWNNNYPGAWWPGKWAVYGTAWASLAWSDCGSYCGCEGEGTYYDYGGNITYENNNVYYGDEPVATAEQYYNQAAELAASSVAPESEEWLPLGVFAIVADPAQTHADKVVQLAVNKAGDVRGNLQDFLTDKVVPVQGAVDRQSQRVSMTLEGVEGLVVDTSLYNLTNDEVPVLLHFSADRQEPRTLIRLQQKAAE
jgi:hypothetical protein